MNPSGFYVDPRDVGSVVEFSPESLDSKLLKNEYKK